MLSRAPVAGGAYADVMTAAPSAIDRVPFTGALLVAFAAAVGCTDYESNGADLPVPDAAGETDLDAAPLDASSAASDEPAADAAPAMFATVDMRRAYFGRFERGDLVEATVTANANGTGNLTARHAERPLDDDPCPEDQTLLEQAWGGSWCGSMHAGEVTPTDMTQLAILVGLLQTEPRTCAGASATCEFCNSTRVTVDGVAYSSLCERRESDPDYGKRVTEIAALLEDVDTASGWVGGR